MKKTTILTLLLALTLFLSAWTPAPASTESVTTGATLIITNPLPKATTVTLAGENNYTFNIQASQTKTFTIETGNYRYKYQGCLDKTYTGKLAYQNGKYELNIEPCKMITLKIINPFFDTYVSEMKGWMNYQITVKPRHTETFSIVAGPYWLSYTCGDKGWEGKVKLRKDKLWVMCN
jgi:hypothetical protein